MSLREKTTSGLMWVSFSSWSVQIIRLGTSILLARLLNPKDFGLIALATVIISLCNILSQSGVGGALIQKHKVDQMYADSAFSINMGLGIFLAILVFLGAPLAALIFNESKLVPIVRVLSVNIVITSLMVVPSFLLEREMAFKKKLSAEVLPAISYGLFALGGAFSGWGVWSLVVGSLASSSIQTILIWRISHYRPKGFLDKKNAHDLWQFGRHIVSASLLLFTVGNMDRVYIGRFFSTTSLGFYNLAININDLPTDLLGRMFNRVMFPAFAKVQTDLLKLKDSYLISLRYISYAAFPISFGIFAVAEPAVRVIYGEKWLPSVPMIYILCFYGLFRNIGSLTGALFTGTGRPKLSLYILIFRIITLGGSMLWLGPHYATIGVATSMTFSMTISVIISIFLVNHYLSINFSDLCQQILPQLAAALIMFFAVWRIGFLFHDPLLKLLLLIPFGALMYFTVLMLFSRSRLIEDLSQILKPLVSQVYPNSSKNG